MGKYKRKFILTLMALLLPILLPRIMIRFGVVDMLTEAYHNFLLDRVEEIHIEDERLIGNTESNINNYGMVAETEDGKNYLSRMNLDGSQALPLDGDNYIDDLGITKEWIFYRTLYGPDPPGLKRMKKEGGSWINMEYTDTY